MNVHPGQLFEATQSFCLSLNPCVLVPAKTLLVALYAKRAMRGQIWVFVTPDNELSHIHEDNLEGLVRPVSK